LNFLIAIRKEKILVESLNLMVYFDVFNKGFKMTEKDPVKTLRAALTDKLHIDPRKNPMEIRMEGDAVVIEGIVDRVALKKRTLLIAMGLEGTSGVVDRLRVRPAKKMTDKEIKDHLYMALCGEPTIDSSLITAEVRDGVVDLEGQVGSLTHQRLCGVLAWWVPGSTDVINSLEVVPPEEDSPEEVKDALRIVLEKDRLVDASSICSSTKDWVVTLWGSVRSAAERDVAEDDAWYIWGVNDVENNIKVIK
jgi:osmotically-inducible protein OsmY